MRNLYQEAIWLYRGDRKPNQVSQGSSLPRNPWNILPLIGCWPVGQSDLNTTKLLSGERKCQLPLKCLNEIKPRQVIPLMVLLLTNLLIKSHHHVQVSAQRALGILCKFNFSLQKCAKHPGLHQFLKHQAAFPFDQYYLRTSISDRGRVQGKKDKPPPGLVDPVW